MNRNCESRHSLFSFDSYWIENLKALNFLRRAAIKGFNYNFVFSVVINHAVTCERDLMNGLFVTANWDITAEISVSKAFIELVICKIRIQENFFKNLISIVKLLSRVHSRLFKLSFVKLRKR